MLRIGLTGSMATGKSTALEAFAGHGAATFSADEAVHRLYAGPAAAAVERLFPGTARQGAVDRARLAEALRRDPARLAELEALIHPMVRDEIARFLEAAAARGAALGVVEVPLLFESGHDYGFDAVVVTVCDEAEQRRRALMRPGMNVEKLERLLARQMPQAEKRRRADFVVDTSGSREASRAQVAGIVRDLQAREASQQ